MQEISGQQKYFLIANFMLYYNSLRGQYPLFKLRIKNVWICNDQIHRLVLILFSFVFGFDNVWEYRR